MKPNGSEIIMHCKPHQNGDTPKTFRDAGRSVSIAGTEFQDAIIAAISEVTNGRNYQHLEPAEARDARERDLEAIDQLRVASKAAIQIGLELFRMGEAE